MKCLRTGRAYAGSILKQAFWGGSCPALATYLVAGFASGALAGLKPVDAPEVSGTICSNLQQLAANVCWLCFRGAC
eukprot:1138005-Pelagomonas_calceolata.AAC.7